MVRLTTVLALVAAVIAVLAIVLSGGGPEKAASPLDEALGYFGGDSPLVAVAPTDPADPQIRALAALSGRLPIVDPLVDRLAGRLGLRGIDFNRDLRPQLGRPLAVGLETGVYRRAGFTKALVAVTRIRSAIKIKRLLVSRPELLPPTKSHGRRIFGSQGRGGFAVAVDGGVLVAGGSRAAVAEAIANRRSPDRLRASNFEKALAGLPRAAVLRVSADPRALLAGSRRLRRALGIKWLSALRGAAATVTAGAHAVRLRFRIATDARLLEDRDLPLAPRSGPIPLIGHPGEVEIGVREPARLVRFGAALVRALEPRRAARVAKILRELRRRGVDPDRDFTARLGANAALAFDPARGGFAARAAVREPAAFKASLQQIAESLPDLAAALGMPGLGVATPDIGESFYALARPHGTTVVFGVVGTELIAATSPRRAAELVSEATHTAPGAHGSLVATTDARKLALDLLAPRLRGLAVLGAPLALGSLGDLTASASIDRSGLSGWLRLQVR